MVPWACRSSDRGLLPSLLGYDNGDCGKFPNQQDEWVVRKSGDGSSVLTRLTDRNAPRGRTLPPKAGAYWDSGSQ